MEIIENISKKNKFKRIVIVDPQLKDSLGHNYRYAHGIQSLFGVETVVIGHRDFFSTDRKLEVLPSLSFDQYDNSAFKKSYVESPIFRLEKYKKYIKKRVEGAYAIFEKNTPVGELLRVFPIVVNILFFFVGVVYQLYKFIVGYGSSAHLDLASIELTQVLDNLKLKESDLVVFQTMMWPTYESLLEINLIKKSVYQCSAIFVMHEDWNIYHTMYGRFVPGYFKTRVLQSMPFLKSKVTVTNEKLQEYCTRWLGYCPEVINEINSLDGLDITPKNYNKNNGLRLLIPGVYRGDKNFDCISTFVKKINSGKYNCIITIHESVINHVDIPPECSRLIRLYKNVDGYESWLEFLNDYDVVYIPYGQAYARRISGILHESKLLNIPVICNKNIADAIYVNNKKFLLDEDDENSLENVLNSLFETDLSDGNHFNFLEHNDFRLSAENDIGWVARCNKPIAILVKPAWTRCGTSVVLDHQNNMLVRNGYFVVELFIKGEPWVISASQIDFMYEVMQGARLNSGGMVSRVLLKNITFLRLLGYIFNFLSGKLPNYLQREEEHLSWCEVDQDLKGFLKKNQPDLILINHVFNSKFGFDNFKSKFSICETHDIQLNQYLLRRPYLADRYQAEFDYEMSRLKSFDRVVNLNEIEHLSIKNSIGEVANYIRPPIYKWPTKIEYKCLLTLLNEQSIAALDTDRIPSKFDLLIVADGHPANIESVQYFLDQVYSKLSVRMTLGIVGSVCKYLEVNLNCSADLFLIGYLRDLGNIYDYVDIIVLPDLVGAGIPIKTDEAIANSTNVIAFNKAVRGFSEQDIKLLNIRVMETADEMVNHLNQYFLSEHKYTKSYLLPDHYTLERYYQNWEELLLTKKFCS